MTGDVLYRSPAGAIFFTDIYPNIPSTENILSTSEKIYNPVYKTLWTGINWMLKIEESNMVLQVECRRNVSVLYCLPVQLLLCLDKPKCCCAVFPQFRIHSKQKGVQC